MIIQRGNMIKSLNIIYKWVCPLCSYIIEDECNKCAETRIIRHKRKCNKNLFTKEWEEYIKIKETRKKTDFHEHDHSHCGMDTFHIDI